MGKAEDKKVSIVSNDWMNGYPCLIKGKLPKKMEMDWEGDWLSPDLVQRWDHRYVIPDVILELKPEFHPMKYHVQSTAVRMILPAKGVLPMGSYIGSPGFGLIHPTTISAAVLQDAGFFEEEDNPENPMRFDAISLAPNFDIPIGRYRMNEIVNLITKWILCDPEEEEALVSIPPEDLSFDDYVNFRHVPLILRESWDREVYRTVFDITTTYTEDQLLAHHMAPMLMSMGTNVRAIMYKHALSRAGLDPTPLRDALTNLEPLINEVIEHAGWMRLTLIQSKII